MTSSGNLRNRARAAVVAGLFAMGSVMPLASGLMAPSVALAAVGDGTGTVTIATTTTNAGAKYDGYRVFIADVVDASAPNTGAVSALTPVSWSSTQMQTAVTGYLGTGFTSWLTRHNYTEGGAGTNATYALQYISEQITGSGIDTDANTDPASVLGSSFAAGLARAIVAANISPTVNDMAAGTATTCGEGYWLFATQDGSAGDTVGTGEVATSAMWVGVKEGGTYNLTAKSAVPSVAKTVKDDVAGTFGNHSDADAGEALTFRLTATLPANYKSFSEYYLKFNDTMTGLAVDSTQLANLKVYVGTVANPTQYNITSTLNETTGKTFSVSDGVGALNVEIPNLMAEAVTKITGANIGSGNIVMVEYEAAPTTTSAMGQAGNPNNVTLTYSSDPLITSKHADTPQQTVKVYNFGLNLLKKDDVSKQPLQGAKFTMQVKADEAKNDDTNEGKYVQADGTLAATAYAFTTGADGKINVPRIDAGVYTLHETAAPSGHKLLDADLTLTVTPTYDSAGALTALGATVSGGNADADWNTAGYSLTNADMVSGVAATVSSGAVDMGVGNKLETVLPGTGMTTSQAGMVAGMLLVAGGLVGMARRRKGISSDGI